MSSTSTSTSTFTPASSKPSKSCQVLSLKRLVALMLIALVVVATLQVEPAEAAQKSDLLFVKGKFIKKDKKGVIVVDDKCPPCCHGHGRRRR